MWGGGERRLIVINWVLVLAAVAALGAVAVAGFALAQWRVAARTESARAVAAEMEERREVDAAYAAVHAEWFRIWAVSEQWRATDLVEWATAGALDPDDIVPRGWSEVTRNLGRLGYTAAYLGSFGFVFAYDAARGAKLLVENARRYMELLPPDEPERAAYESRLLPRLRTLESTVKELATEAADILEDALDHAPDGDRSRSIRLNQRLRSRHAQELADRTGRLRGSGADREARPHK